MFRDPVLTSAVLDGLPAHIALIDRSGVLRWTNRAWREFGGLNGAHPGFDGEWGNLSSDVIALLNFSGTSGSVDTGNVSSPSSGGSTSSGSDDDAASGGNTSSGGSTTTDGDTGTTAPPPPSSSNLIDVIGTSSNDRLAVSNAGSSKVQGLAGNDVLKGGSGNYNELLGGRGNDVYLISSNGDKVIENAGEEIGRAHV